jgi:hypothetical protein
MPSARICWQALTLFTFTVQAGRLRSNSKIPVHAQLVAVCLIKGTAVCIMPPAAGLVLALTPSCQQ